MVRAAAESTAQAAGAIATRDCAVSRNVALACAVAAMVRSIKLGIAESSMPDCPWCLSSPGALSLTLQSDKVARTIARRSSDGVQSYALALLIAAWKLGRRVSTVAATSATSSCISVHH